MLNKNIYQFHLRMKNLTAVPYKLQNSWEENFEVPIPWHMVYELTRKATSDSKLWIVQFKLLYRILATNIMLFIWGMQTFPALQILLWRDRFIRLFVLVLSICSLILVAGPGMAEELQHLPGANPVDSNTGRSEKS